MGWFWFLIALGPVIGLVQVGEQAMADRYTYIPSIGLFLLVSWEAPRWLGRRPCAGVILGLAATVVLAACLIGTSRQLRYWQNSVTLFSRAVAVTRDNALAHCNLGQALAAAGKPQAALAQLDEALRLKPDYATARNDRALVLYQQGASAAAIRELNRALEFRPAWDKAENNLGLILFDQGKLAEAEKHFRTAIKSKPDSDSYLTNLGLCLAREDRLDDALAAYRQALALAPNAFAENALGRALEIQGKFGEASAHYAAAAAIKPNFAEAYNNLGASLTEQGRFADAVGELTTALTIRTNFADAEYNLGNAHLGLGNLDTAAADYTAALRLQPDFTEAHFNLGIALTQQGNSSGAVEHYRAALRLNPQLPGALKELAWILATHPDPKLRDGAEALRLSTQATHLAATDATAWDIRAAACAEAGQFTEAISAAKKALELANATKQPELAAPIQKRLELYEAGKAFHADPTQTQLK